MNISDDFLLKSCFSTAVFCTLGLGYLIYSNQLNGITLFIGLFSIVKLLVEAYKISKNNSLDKLIMRNGNQLKCKSAGTISTFNIDIKKIGKVTILKNYVSIIEPNNSNGFDILLVGEAQEIMDYMKNLFTKEELGTIEFISAYKAFKRD